MGVSFGSQHVSRLVRSLGRAAAGWADQAAATADDWSPQTTNISRATVTCRYPDENDYDAFLTAHGGASNACTEEVRGAGQGWKSAPESRG